MRKFGRLVVRDAPFWCEGQGGITRCHTGLFRKGKTRSAKTPFLAKALTGAGFQRAGGILAAKKQRDGPLKK